MVEKKAFTAAPTPMVDCAEIEATAWPMKYARGMTEKSDSRKMKKELVRAFLTSRAWRRTKKSNMTNATMLRRLNRIMFVPSMVYFQYLHPVARYVHNKIVEGVDSGPLV